MIYRYSTLSLAMLFASLLVLAGCNAQAGSGGSDLIPLGESGDGGGNPVVTPGGGSGGGDPDTTPPQDAVQTDTDSNGNEADEDTDVPSPDTGAGQDGDGGDPAPSASPPSVVLNVSNLSPSVGDLLFLTCVVTDSGGLPPTSFQFDSSIGTATIIQDGSEIASARVLASPLTVNYTCSASNDAGQGDPSPIVFVTTAGSGF